MRRIKYSCLFKKYEFFIGTRCQIFPCNVFGNGRIKPIRITERGSSGVREGLSQSRLRYSRAVRTPRRADLFENPRKWHVSPVVRRLATLYAPRRCLSPSRHSPFLPYATPSHYLARSLLFPRASNAPPDFLTLPVRFRYSRSKLSVASPGASLASSLAPLSDFNVVRLRASNQKHERYFCTWSPLFSFFLLLLLFLHPAAFFLSCRQRFPFPTTNLSAVLSAILPTFLLSASSLREVYPRSRPTYTCTPCALAYKLLFSENEERG